MDYLQAIDALSKGECVLHNGKEVKEIIDWVYMSISFKDKGIHINYKDGTWYCSNKKYPIHFTKKGIDF